MSSKVKPHNLWRCGKIAPMSLTPLRTTPVTGKNVLVRLDLDLPPKRASFDTTRLEDGLPTLKYLLEGGAKKITVISHLGRPNGKRVLKMSLKPVYKLLLKHFTKEEQKKLVLMENLRFDSREEKGSAVLARSLAKGQDLFVNDAFASSHREHTSIVEVPKLLPTVMGFQFEKEITNLEKVVKTPKRPLILILGGAKLETKLPLLEKMQKVVDVILVGGKLAEELKEHPIVNRKIVVGKLNKTGKDINYDTIQQFFRFITMAGTVVWNGPMGKYEDKQYRNGTAAIARHLSQARAYSVVGGGDTEAALTVIKATKGIDFISSGGGAMLDYLAYGTMPGIEAMEKSKKVA